MPSSSLHYDIIEEIGRGATSIVYRAHDPRLGRDVALKVSRTDFFEPDLDDFVREARVLAKLQHRFIVPVYEAGLFDGKPAIAMQLVEGRTLDHVQGEGSIDLADAIKYGEQLLEALSFAHERDVIHRDVKPSNIFITDSGNLLLSDFGLARSLGSATITATGSVLGSPGYFAPEQVKGEASNPATDVFSAGVVLFQMLTGRNPYLEETGGELPAIAYKITHDNLPSVSKFAPNTSRNIARAVRRATQRAQAARFADATEMLTAWRSGLRTSELFRSLLLNAWFDRRVKTFAIAGALTVAVGALGLAYIWSSDATSIQPEVAQWERDQLLVSDLHSQERLVALHIEARYQLCGLMEYSPEERNIIYSDLTFSDEHDEPASASPDYLVDAVRLRETVEESLPRDDLGNSAKAWSLLRREVEAIEAYAVSRAEGHGHAAERELLPVALELAFLTDAEIVDSVDQLRDRRERFLEAAATAPDTWQILMPMVIDPGMGEPTLTIDDTGYEISWQGDESGLWAEAVAAEEWFYSPTQNFVTADPIIGPEGPKVFSGSGARAWSWVVPPYPSDGATMLSIALWARDPVTLPHSFVVISGAEPANVMPLETYAESVRERPKWMADPRYESSFVVYVQKHAKTEGHYVGIVGNVWGEGEPELIHYDEPSEVVQRLPVSEALSRGAHEVAREWETVPIELLEEVMNQYPPTTP